jgi:glycosyltransferase involved in cell wall biosynthesis
VKLLVILSRDPSGRGSGRRTVISSTIEALVGLGHEVRVLVLARSASAPVSWPGGVQLDLLPLADPMSIVVNLLGGALFGRLSLNECLFVSKQARRRVEQVAGDWQPDIVVADMIRSYEMALAAGRPLIVDLDDLLSERYASAGSGSGSGFGGTDSTTILGYYQEGLPAPVRGLAGVVAVRLLRIESRILRRREHIVARSAAATVMVSDEEAASLSSATGRPVFAIPMAISATPPSSVVDVAAVEPWPNGGILFFGGLDYQPNRQAVEWFVEEVLPELRRLERPDICLHVIGYCPPETADRLVASGVVVHGYVDDLGAVLRAHPIVVAPILSGSGVKTKVIEAMAYGCAVVTTAVGAKGTGAIDETHCRIVDSPEAFAAAVLELVDDRSVADQMGQRASVLISDRFSLEVVAGIWRTVLDTVQESTQAGPRVRSLFLNDYPMDEALAEWRRGEYPGQHLFGVTHLPGLGVDVDILPFGRFSPLRSWVSKRVGDVGQQVRVLMWARPYDVLYAGSQYDTVLLSVLRSLGIYRRPLVATMHHMAKGPLRRPWLFRALYRGHDLLLCMSDDIEGELVEVLGFPRAKVLHVGWAVDLDFYRVRTDPAADVPLVIAAGKTKRDYRTLVDAVDGLPCQVEIYCSANSAPRGPYANNVRVVFNEADPGQASALTMAELLARYRQSWVVAIPLPAQEVRGTTGLTSLLEAMAMGRSVVMTSNTSIDVEAEDCGIFVQPGDTAGWRQAINRLVGDRDLTNRLGRSARQVCEERFRLEDYSARIAAALRSVAEHG